VYILPSASVELEHAHVERTVLATRGGESGLRTAFAISANIRHGNDDNIPMAELIV
jgi:hypothetical protein